MIRTRLTKDPLQRRLTPLVVSSFAGGLALWVPVEKLLMDDIGFTPATVGVMAAAYAAVVPLLEVPSGLLADRWSRRGVLVVGNVGAMLSVMIGGLSTNVATYVVAALLLGVYFAMQSGTFDAVVYDTLLEETGTSDDFEKVLGQMRIVSSAALVIGALAGGTIGALSTPRVTYFATLPFLAISIATLLAFREPTLHQAEESTNLRQHLVQTIDAVREKPRLLPVVALLMATSLLTQAIYEFGPLWLLKLDASTALYGPAWALLMSSLGLGGALARRIRLDSPKSLIAVVALLTSASITLVVSRDPIVVTIAQVVLATFAVAVGVFATRVLHDGISSAVRSSVASGIGAASWIAFLPFALVFGMVSDRLGVHTAAWLLIAGVAATTGLLLSVTRRAVSAQPISLVAPAVGLGTDADPDARDVADVATAA